MIILENKRAVKLAIESTRRLQLMLFICLITNKSRKIIKHSQLDAILMLRSAHFRMGILQEQKKEIDVVSWFVNTVALGILAMLGGVIWILLRQ